jgi:hypothetical protein
MSAISNTYGNNLEILNMSSFSSKPQMLFSGVEFYSATSKDNQLQNESFMCGIIFKMLGSEI